MCSLSFHNMCVCVCVYYSKYHIEKYMLKGSLRDSAGLS